MNDNRINDIISKIRVHSHDTDFILTISTTDDFKRYTAFVEDQTDSAGNKIHCPDFMIINYPDSLQNQIMNEYTLDDLNKLSEEREKSFEEIEYVKKYVRLADEQFERRSNKIIELFLDKHADREKSEFDFILEAKNNANNNNNNNGPSTPEVKNYKQPFMPSLEDPDIVTNKIKVKAKNEPDMSATDTTIDPNAPGFDLPKNQPDCSTVTDELKQRYHALYITLKSLLLKLPHNNYKIDDKNVYIKDNNIMIEEDNKYLALGENAISMKASNDSGQTKVGFDKISAQTKFYIMMLMRDISLKIKLDLAQGGIH